MSSEKKGLEVAWEEERQRARKAEDALRASDRRVSELEREIGLAVVILGRGKNHPALLEKLNTVLKPALIKEPGTRGYDPKD